MKPYSKKRGIITLVVFALAFAFILYTVLAGITYDKIGRWDQFGQGLDLRGGVSITYEVKDSLTPSQQVMDDTIEKLQQRVLDYSLESNVYQEGANRIVVEIPGEDDPEAVLKNLGNPGSLYFCLDHEIKIQDTTVEEPTEKEPEGPAEGEEEDASALLGVAGAPSDEMDVDAALLSADDEETTETEEKKTVEVNGTTYYIMMDGALVNDAQAAYDPDDVNKFIVQLVFSLEGQQRFAQVTKEIAGTDEPLYIIFDNRIVSAPTCQETINSTFCEINGISAREEAEMIASAIRSGALKTELSEIRSQVIGATLGSDAVTTSMIAMLVGLAVICILMLVVFRLPGFCASVALVMYTALMFLILSLFKEEITLTLPGIAGIVLGIGMAVDANCIIFSRIKEEIGLGSGTHSAIGAGFKKALSAIIDGNVTTLIAAIVLFLFGSGPVKGFATTLAIGILLSMFTSLVITKLLLQSFYAIGFKNKKWYGQKKPAKAKKFVEKRSIFLIVSLAAIVIGVGFLIGHGVKDNSEKDGYMLNYSLEYVGGTSTTVKFDQYRNAAQLEAEVLKPVQDAIGSQDVTLVPSMDTTNTEVVIKTQELTQEKRDAMYEVLETEFGVDTSNITYESISATVSKETSRKAIISVVLAAIAMLLYIWIRFRDIRFASASVLCLVHDVLVVLAGYAVFRWTVGNTFIACMLTLVGYSINATIVVFDRIRENLQEMGAKADLREVANLSVTQTLGRSVYTSVTTLVMVISLYIFGGTAIKEFALPLMVGLVVGCYSSVCLAASLWYIFKTKFTKKKA